jgi:hypothetical protein
MRRLRRFVGVVLLSGGIGCQLITGSFSVAKDGGTSGETICSQLQPCCLTAPVEEQETCDELVGLGVDTECEEFAAQYCSTSVIVLPDAGTTTGVDATSFDAGVSLNGTSWTASFYTCNGGSEEPSAGPMTISFESEGDGLWTIIESESSGTCSGTDTFTGASIIGSTISLPSTTIECTPTDCTVLCGESTGESVYSYGYIVAGGLLTLTSGDDTDTTCSQLGMSGPIEYYLTQN